MIMEKFLNITMVIKFMLILVMIMVMIVGTFFVSNGLNMLGIYRSGVTGLEIFLNIRLFLLLVTVVIQYHWYFLKYCKQKFDVAVE